MHQHLTVGLPLAIPSYTEKWGIDIVQLLRDGWSLRFVNSFTRTPWGIER